eukprot:TRINITY_DN14600_c0_g1_i2.p1 TRINITY_DN14600_c0_g1~~TRINITY_DN14600_c0_g1_i2.p1  ORF type:complete len:423 (+),score=65.65 TRINITY_DN14600_c0_g1_i2:46-1314(+)
MQTMLLALLYLGGAAAEWSTARQDEAGSPSDELFCKTPEGMEVAEGTTYDAGECNTCTCHEGSLLCTDLDCSKPLPWVCVVDETTHPHGTIFDSNCNRCLCWEGMTRCTNDDCSLPLNCDWSAMTPEPWTNRHRNKCCTEQQVDCRSDEEFQTEKSCQELGLNCPVMKYNCDKPASLTPEMAEWCCGVENKLCEIDCSVPTLLPETAKTKCCKLKGIGCPNGASNTAHPHDGFQLKLDWNTEALLDNPKAFLRKFRNALVTASPLLSKNTSNLVMTSIGVLMAGGEVPQKEKWDKWAFTVTDWNDECLEEELRLERSAGLLGAASEKTKKTSGSHKGVFGEYYLKGDSAAKIQAEINARTKNVIIDEPASSSSLSWVYWAAAGFGALCIGSALAVTVYRKKNAPLTSSELFEELHEVEVGRI